MLKCFNHYLHYFNKHARALELFCIVAIKGLLLFYILCGRVVMSDSNDPSSGADGEGKPVPSSTKDSTESVPSASKDVNKG